MSGYQRMAKLKRCIGSLNNLKNVQNWNNYLSKEIGEMCTRTKKLYKSTVDIQEVKKVNSLLNDAVKLSSSAKPCVVHSKVSPDAMLNKLNENITQCKLKVKEQCKTLHLLANTIEEKTSQYKSQYVRSRHVKREAEKLCKSIARGRRFGRSLVWTASGLSLVEGPTASNVNQAAAATSAAPIDPIPEPPPIPDVAAEALNQLNALGEQTFASLGLGGWSPIGILQNCLEFAHVNLGLEWWLAIMLGTLIIRILLFPLVILAQRNAAKMNNYLPQMQALQVKITEARQCGDSLSAARYSQELMVFMKEKGVNPFKNMLVPLAQAPIFISFFMGLRQMTNVPVESLAHGGIFWFVDLTLPDQYYLLPILTSLTLWITVEVGTDAGKLSAQNLGMLKYVFRGLPIVILPFTINFPGAILCYWVSSNLISLVQVSFLRIPKVRNYFNIEPMVNYTPEQLPVKPKGFTEGFKESWTNIKITKEIEERRRLDEIQFQRAGKGPIQKTFNYDPTKQISSSSPTAISAKKR